MCVSSVTATKLCDFCFNPRIVHVCKVSMFYLAPPCFPHCTPCTKAAVMVEAANKRPAMTKSTAKPAALPESAVTTNPARMVAATERHIHEIVHSSIVSMCR